MDFGGLYAYSPNRSAGQLGAYQFATATKIASVNFKARAPPALAAGRDAQPLLSSSCKPLWMASMSIAVE